MGRMPLRWGLNKSDCSFEIAPLLPRKVAQRIRTTLAIAHLCTEFRDTAQALYSLGKAGKHSTDLPSKCQTFYKRAKH